MYSGVIFCYYYFFFLSKKKLSGNIVHKEILPLLAIDICLNFFCNAISFYTAAGISNVITKSNATTKNMDFEYKSKRTLKIWEHDKERQTSSCVQYPGSSLLYYWQNKCRRLKPDGIHSCHKPFNIDYLYMELLRDRGASPLHRHDVRGGRGSGQT